MREATERTATNILATSLHDLAYGIWDADGCVIVIPEGFPCRLISSTYPIKAVLNIFGKQICSGDEFLTNHLFKAGAVHLPDNETLIAEFNIESCSKRKTTHN